MRAVYHGRRPPGAHLSVHLDTTWATTPDGWRLRLQRLRVPGLPEAPREPVLLVHGYGMNSWVFHEHPTGPSLMEHLARAGLDPWSVDLRGTRSSVAPRPGAPVRLADQAFLDVPTALDLIASRSRVDRVSAIGCSLGGALLYAYAGAMDHRLDRIVTMGSPLVFQDPSWLLRLAGALPGPVARVPVRGTRHLARLALPAAVRFAPSLLSVYLNPANVDLRAPGRLLETVENPHPDVSSQLTRWIREGHLVLDGHHVTEGLGGVHTPLLVVYGDGDGVCPPAAAAAAVAATAGPAAAHRVALPGRPVSHVDLFVGRDTETAVFPAVSGFLRGTSTPEVDAADTPAAVKPQAPGAA